MSRRLMLGTGQPLGTGTEHGREEEALAGMKRRMEQLWPREKLTQIAALLTAPRDFNPRLHLQLLRRPDAGQARPLGGDGIHVCLGRLGGDDQRTQVAGRIDFSVVEE